VNLLRIVDAIWHRHRYATADDIRNTMGEYHNVLRWLTKFLIEDANDPDAYIVDAGALTETQMPDFHEWLVHWAARATVRNALQGQHERIAQLTAQHEKSAADHLDHPPITIDQFQALIRNSEQVRSQLDVLCRFVLLIRGIAKESVDDVAGELGISRRAVEHAYCVAFDLISSVAAK